MPFLHTKPETGTYPEDIERVVRSLRFETEVKENLTLDELEQATKRQAAEFQMLK